MDKISVVIICKDEEQNIRRCLESVKWADEIVIYDTGSEDKTLDICKEYTHSIYIESSWQGFGHAKHSAVNHAKYDWIFSIDADEEVTESLKDRLFQLKDTLNPALAYRIKRSSFYMGKAIKYSGWQRDYTLRLFHRQYGNFNLKKVHESVETRAETQKLHEILNHYTYPKLKTHINKMILYSELGAESLYNKQKKSGIYMACFRGFIKFLKMYVFNLGFLDGKVGFALALNSGFGVYLKYLYLWERDRLSPPRNMRSRVS
jgi:glycosyltransferase involved in cell wall biosynthesis